MARLVLDVFSDVLEVGTSVTVVLPQRTQAQIGVPDGQPAGDPPVLYLLHGLSDDHTAWGRYTAVDRYAEARGLAVVMPAVSRSFYADEVHGLRYWTYLSQELPTLVQSFFRVSSAPEDTFVAGLSMGGYGALKWALHEPQRFAAVACLSGAVDLRELFASGARSEVFARAFGSTVPDDAELFGLLERADPQALPPLHLSCGSDDPLVGGCRRFAQAYADRGGQVTADFPPGGHEWGLWDRVIAEVVEWLPIRAGGAAPGRG